MFYTIYKTTNTLTGKVYIGKHITANPDDDYLGSGTALHRAIMKYGKDPFVKEVLFIFDSKDEMDQKERELVTEEWVARRSTYNIALGGKGGWDPIKSRTAFSGRSHNAATKEKISASNRGKKLTEEQREKIREHNRTHVGRKQKISETMRGRTLSEETKKKLSESIKRRHEAGAYDGKLKGIPKPRVECPHCGKVTSPNNLVRWHGDNCKHR